jgi:uncharacterized protein (UPF0332 family)
MTIPSAEDIHAELKGASEMLEEAEQALQIKANRIALSGAYYAIFHAARAAPWSRGKNAKTHGGLAMQFRTEFILTGTLEQEFAEILKAGRDERERADYDMINFEATAEGAQSALSDARRFVQKMTELIAG